MASSCASGMFIGRVFKGILAGAVAGLVGAWVMGKFQERTQAQIPGASDSDEEQATAKAAGAVAQAVLDRPLTRSEKPAAAEAAHYGMGALSGAIYGGAVEVLPVVKAGLGVPFGAVLWVIGDEVLVPYLGLAKPPTEYPLNTHADALAAHMVYGVATEVARRVVKAMLQMPLIVDAHLDLAFNAGNGRDVTRHAAEQPTNEDGFATVGLPDLRAGGVGMVCATIFCAPSINGSPGYTTPAEARTSALSQLGWYRQQILSNRLQLVQDANGLPFAEYRSPPFKALLLMEGADPLRTPDDLPEWFAAGLRIVGLAWKATRFAGGTGMPGPLTAAGRELVPELDRAGILHDVSHLAEESFWQLLELTDRPILASHSNCRAIVPTDRQLSDEMIRAITQRGGVIGINFYDKFLLPPTQYGKRRATLADVIRHIDHICQLTGSASHVAIGTDMDGGFGREQIPEEIRTSADLPRVGDALADAGYPAAEAEAILGGNWLRYFRDNLPGG